MNVEMLRAWDWAEGGEGDLPGVWLRVSSRLIVLGARSGRRAISRTDNPSTRPLAISVRSSALSWR